MKTQIKDLTAELCGDYVKLSYTLKDQYGRATVPLHQIKLSALVEFVKENRLNQAYLIAPDELTTMDAETYTLEDLLHVVRVYMEDSLCV